MLREEELKLTEITNYRVKIQEMNGTQIRRILCQKNPFKGLHCNRHSCMVCKNEGKGECRRRSVTYMTTCDLCKANNAAAGIPDTAENVAAYWGEASRSAAERSAEHLQDYRAKKEDSHMFKHQQLDHPGEDVTFTMKILKKHKTAFSRMVEEGTLITINQNSSKILNSKSGYNRSQIPRLTVSMGENVVSDSIPRNDYSNAQVEEIFSENNRRQTKNRGRGDETNIQIPHPPIKRRRYQFFSRKSSIKRPDPNNERVPDEQRKKSLVKEGDQQQHTELDTNDSNASASSNPNLQYFSIFSKPGKGAKNLLSKADNSIPPKGKHRKPGIRIKNSPPTKESKITNHFKPASRLSEASNELEVEAGGEQGSETSSVDSVDQSS